jgi:hypothetical protein
VAFTLMQVALGAFCVVGAFVGVTFALSGTSESFGEYVRLARVDAWPEIKRGVPALLEPRALVLSSAAPSAQGISEPTLAALDPLSSLPVPDPPPAQPIMVQPLPEKAGSAYAEVGDASGQLISLAPSTKEAELSGLKRDEATDHGPAVMQDLHAPTSTTVTTRPAQKSGGTKPIAAKRQDTARASAAPSSVPPPLNVPSVENQPKRAETAAPGSPPEAHRASKATADRLGTKRAADATKPQPNQRQGNSTRPARTRTAEAKASVSPESTPAAQAPPETKEERVHLLGVLLPTRRQVRECLLELRC